jgi:hypothetical protein
VHINKQQSFSTNQLAKLNEHPALLAFANQQRIAQSQIELACIEARPKIVDIGVEGVADIQMQHTTGLPMLSIQPKLEKRAQYGISKADIQQQLSIPLAGT